MDLYAITVIGYLFYTLAQVFTFCIYGNQLIEEVNNVSKLKISALAWHNESHVDSKNFA